MRQEAVADTPRPAFEPSPSLEATTSLATGWELVARRSPRELEAARQTAQLALERDPRYVAAGRSAAAIAPDTPIVRGALAKALARAGRRRDAERLIRQLDTEPLPAAGILMAGAHVALGNPRRVIDCMAEAREIGAPQFAYAFVDSALAALRCVPAFERMRPTGKWSG